MLGTVKQLVVIEGPDKGRTFMIPTGEALPIGRGGSTATRLNDLRVSRTHCTIKEEGGRVVVTDCQSTVGTFVNDQRISEHQLQAGDVIRIGDTQMKFLEEEVAEAATLAGVPFAAGDGNVSPGAAAAGAAALAQAPLAELVGTTLNHFTLSSLLARGRSSVVFGASDTRTGTDVALKVFLPGFLKSDAELQRMSRALQPLLSLRHPNLISHCEIGKTGPHIWVAMELIEGESLTQIIQRIGIAGMLDWQHALRIAIHMARALDFLHQHQIVHRNLSPKNILLNTNDKLAKLGGLTRAKVLDLSVVEMPTRTEDILRDGAYMPPERVRDDSHGDTRSDIYSLGATIYALLTGRPPFDAKSPVDMIAKILQSEPVSAREFQLALPEGFEQALARMLAKKPEDRYQTPAELLGDLERIAPSVALAKKPAAPSAAPSPAPAAAPTETPEGYIGVVCKCGQKLQAREKYAGTRVRCPACRNFLILPGEPLRDSHAPRLSPLPVSEAALAAEGQEKTSIVVWIVSAVAFVGFLAAILFFLGFLGKPGKAGSAAPNTPAESKPNGSTK